MKGLWSLITPYVYPPGGGIWGYAAGASAPAMNCQQKTSCETRGGGGTQQKKQIRGMNHLSRSLICMPLVTLFGSFTQQEGLNKNDLKASEDSRVNDTYVNGRIRVLINWRKLWTSCFPNYPLTWGILWLFCWWYTCDFCVIPSSFLINYTSAKYNVAPPNWKTSKCEAIFQLFPVFNQRLNV